MYGVIFYFWQNFQPHTLPLAVLPITCKKGKIPPFLKKKKNTLISMNRQYSMIVLLRVVHRIFTSLENFHKFREPLVLKYVYYYCYTWACVFLVRSLSTIYITSLPFEGSLMMCIFTKYIHHLDNWSFRVFVYFSLQFFQARTTILV